MVLGNLKHALLERLLAAAPGELEDDKFGRKARMGMVDSVLAESVADRACVEMGDPRAKNALVEAAKLLTEWVRSSFLGKGQSGGGAASGAAAQAGSKGGAATHKLGSDKLVFKGLVTTEEDIWSPEWGLKGKVDATVLALPKPGPLAKHFQPTNRAAAGSAGALGQPAAVGGKGEGQVYALELKTVNRTPGDKVTRVREGG